MARKTITKTAQVDTFAVVRTDVASTLADTFKGWASLAVDAQSKRHEFAATVRASLISLRVAAGTDGAGYMGAVADIFGNGLKHTQKGYMAGSLREALKATQTTDRTSATQVSYARSVALWLAEPANLAKAQKSDENGDAPTFRNLYDLAKTPSTKTKASTEASAKPIGSGVDLDHLTPEQCEQIITRMGIAASFNALARILKANKATALEGLTAETLASKFKTA